MKRILALTLAVLMTVALLCACGEKKSEEATENSEVKTVTSVVDPKYDNSVAEKFAKSVTTDKDGNKVYEFEADSYNEYLRNYNNQVSAEITNDVMKNHEEKFGQYCYINEEKKAIIVGVNPGKYDEKVASKEAEALAEKSYSFFQTLETPVDAISVQYVNANDQDEVYGKFDFTIK